MIVSCPACRTRYRVDESELRGRAARTVRCANCGHMWRQAVALSGSRSNQETTRLEDRIEPALEVPPRPTGAAVTPPLELPPRPTLETAAIMRGGRGRWRAFRWIVLIVLFVLAILAWIVGARGAA